MLLDVSCIQYGESVMRQPLSQRGEMLEDCDFINYRPRKKRHGMEKLSYI
jgi:hypothetical protein